jgi:hypothetical protein
VRTGWGELSRAPGEDDEMIRLVSRAVIAGLVIGILLSAGITVWKTLCKSSIFTVAAVEIRGVERTDREKLRAIYQPFVGKNIFDEITPSALLTDDEWVRRIEMKRVLPNKLVVLVEEEKELISYKAGDSCLAKTESGAELAIACETVRISIVERPLEEEFEEFIEIYTSSEFLQTNDITLENGFFHVNSNGVNIVASYQPGVFIKNYDVFMKQIRSRYKYIESIDMTVKNKVYVKGVING